MTVMAFKNVNAPVRNKADDRFGSYIILQKAIHFRSIARSNAFPSVPTDKADVSKKEP